MAKWKIISKRNGTNVTASSESWKFYLSGEGLSNYPPYPASLLAPKSGKSFQSSTTTVELSWEGLDADGDLLTYDLYIDTIDGNQSPDINNTLLSETSKVVEVSSGNSYFWRIKSIDIKGNSSFSIIYSFSKHNIIIRNNSAYTSSILSIGKNTTIIIT